MPMIHNAKVHLFVISHKEVDIPHEECIIPLRADKASGIHIAHSENYSELRSHYWVWKNVDFPEDDYVGFFHYRRYLDLAPGHILSCPIQCSRPRPYHISKKPIPGHYTEANVLNALAGFDAIAPIWEYTGLSVWKRYAQSSKHHIEDLDLAYQIISKKHPAFCLSADRYFNGLGEYFGNIYIMRWSLFKKYCDWLFCVLNEFDSKRAFHQNDRVDGYLGERLFGVYFTWLKEEGIFSCGECPRIHFSCYDDDKHHMALNAASNILLPPGSALRGRVRQIVSKIPKKQI